MGTNQFEPLELPQILAEKVQERALDEKTARRIEFFRRTRGVDSQVSGASFDPRFVSDRFHEKLAAGPCLWCSKNAPAAEVTKAAAELKGWSHTHNPLCVYGNCDEGKKTFLATICSAACPGDALMIHVEDMAMEYARLRTLQEKMEFRAWLGTHQVLALEDIHMCEGKLGLQREIVSLIASMIVTGSIVAVSSIKPPEGLIAFEPALKALLAMGALASVETTTREERVQVAQRGCRGTCLDRTMAEYLVERIPRSCFTLAEAVSRLVEIQEKTEEPVTADMVETIACLVSGSNDASHACDHPATQSESCPTNGISEPPHEKAEHYKELILNASCEQEQLTVLEMAFEDILDRLYAGTNNDETKRTMALVLQLVRSGKLEEAMKCLRG